MNGADYVTFCLEMTLKKDTVIQDNLRWTIVATNDAGFKALVDHRWLPCTMRTSAPPQSWAIIIELQWKIIIERNNVLATGMLRLISTNQTGI